MERLSEPMRQMLREAKPGVPLPPGPTRAALMARGLVYNMVGSNKDLRCKLTAMGLSMAAQIHDEDKESRKVFVLKNEPTMQFTVALGKAMEALDIAIGCLHRAQAMTPLPNEVSGIIGNAAGGVMELLNIHLEVKRQLDTKPVKHSPGEIGAECGASFRFPQEIVITTDEQVTCPECQAILAERGKGKDE